MKNQKKKQKRPPVKASLDGSLPRSANVAFHEATPVVKRVSSLFASDPGNGPMGGDPYLPAAKVQYIRKCDYSTSVMDYSQCVTQSVYSSGQDVELAKRIHWIPPMMLKQPSKDGQPQIITGDQRGVFADIGVTRVCFKNVSKQPIKVIVNSPRARIDDITHPYVRRFKRDMEVAPGRSKWFVAGWGDKANIFTPMVVKLAEGDGASTGTDTRYITFAVADFVVVAPDIDEMSGKTAKELSSQSVVEVKYQQGYISTASYMGLYSNVTFQQRKPFVISKLKISSSLYEWAIDVKGAVERPLEIKSVAGSAVLHADGSPFNLEGPENRLVVFDGVQGYFKLVRGNVVFWDVKHDRPQDILLEPIYIPANCSYRLLEADVCITLKDVISWLTTVTEILTVVSMVL